MNPMQIGAHTVTLVRTTRKQSIALKFKPGQVALLVPRHLSSRQITQLIDTHQAWLHAQLQHHAHRLAVQPQLPKPDFARQPGAQFEWLGQPLVAQYVANSSNMLALKQHLISQAHAYIAPKLAKYAQHIGVNVRQLHIKTYKSRWGSCYTDGRIQFNWRLMQAPAFVVDYVIVHELCHLIHANHSAHFWALVAHHYPQTPQARAYLKTHGTRLIGFLEGV
jgi:hypothetical protein